MIYKHTTVAGGTIFVTISGAGNQKSGQRGRREKPTAPEVMEMNRKYAERSLSMILNHNFGAGDLHTVLTYGGDAPDPAEAKTRINNFIRKMRRLYEKKGLVFKWVLATEYKNHRIHHHFVCTGGVSLWERQDLWPWGMLRDTPLRRDRDYRKLAAYLIKETDKTFRLAESVGKRRYTCSRNIERPQMKRESVSARLLLEDPKPVKGYYIDKESVHKGVNPFTGRIYLEYVMVSIDPRPRISSWRRGKSVPWRVGLQEGYQDEDRQLQLPEG